MHLVVKVLKTLTALISLTWGPHPHPLLHISSALSLQSFKFCCW